MPCLQQMLICAGGIPPLQHAMMMTGSGGAPFIWNVGWDGSGNPPALRYCSPYPSSAGKRIAFGSRGSTFIAATTATPYVWAQTYSTAGNGGTKYADPGTLPAGAGDGVAFSGTYDAVAVGHATSPFITAYPWSDITGYGTKYANPGTLPGAAAKGISFNRAGTYVALAYNTTSPFVAAYPFSSVSGFGTKCADPSSVIASNCFDIHFTELGDYLAVASGAGVLYAYAFSGGFGTRTSSSATSGSVQGCAFNHAGTYAAAAVSATPFIYAWPFSAGTFGTKVANPAQLGYASATGVAWNGDDTCIGMTNNHVAGTQSIDTWAWTGSAFGSHKGDPGDTSSCVGYGIAFTPAGP